MDKVNLPALLNRVFLVLCIIGSSYQACAENSVVPFNDNFALNFYGNFNILSFAQKNEGQYVSQSPWSIGLGIRYKNLSMRLFLPLQFDNNPFDIQVNSYYDKMYYEVFCKQYKEFRNEDSDNEHEYRESGLDILSAGMLAGWIQNNKRHSLSSVYNLDKKQTESSGSFLYGFGVFYTTIHSTGEYNTNYSERKHLIYFGPAAGYSYTWVFPHDIFCNVNLTAGLNMGVNAASGTILFVPQIMPKFVVGYHTESWSVNVIGGCTYTSILWPDSGFDSLLSAAMTLAFSRRF